MEPVKNTNPSLSSLRAAQQARDVAAPRRAFLDTYARQRAGLPDQPEPIQQAQPIAMSAPTQQVQTSVHSMPVFDSRLLDDSVIETQPPVTGAVADYQPLVAPGPTSVQAEVEQQLKDHKSYLDTLQRRHIQAVSAAPAAEETVTQPTLDLYTQSLFEAPDNQDDDEKIEANLKALYNGEYSLTSQLAKSTTSASASHVRTIVASAFACGVIAVGMFTFLGRFSSQPVVAQPIDSPIIEVDSSNTTVPNGNGAKTNGGGPTQTDPAYPTRLLISSIGVNAPVQSLGMTSDGLIAVPKSYGVVGWYNKGSIPGQPGPAVLVGHYTGGNGGVFDKLKDLNDGDLITVTNGKGQTFTYKVSAKNEYDKENVPMADLFKRGTDSRLEIITCSGQWQSQNYNKRLVITAQIVK